MIKKDINIKIRISTKEYEILKKQKNQSAYIRQLILNSNTTTNYSLIIQLSSLWEEMKKENINEDILNKLKNIILSIQHDN